MKMSVPNENTNSSGRIFKESIALVMKITDTDTEGAIAAPENPATYKQLSSHD